MIGDRVDVLAPRSRTENEGAAGNPKAIAPCGADINHGGLFEVGNTRVGQLDDRSVVWSVGWSGDQYLTCFLNAKNEPFSL